MLAAIGLIAGACLVAAALAWIVPRRKRRSESGLAEEQYREDGSTEQRPKESAEDRGEPEPRVCQKPGRGGMASSETDGGKPDAPPSEVARSDTIAADSGEGRNEDAAPDGSREGASSSAIEEGSAPTAPAADGEAEGESKEEPGRAAGNTGRSHRGSRQKQQGRQRKPRTGQGSRTGSGTGNSPASGRQEERSLQGSDSSGAAKPSDSGKQDAEKPESQESAAERQGYRDRRGGRRPSGHKQGGHQPGAGNRMRARAELRLSLHPIQRKAALTVILHRREQFPERVMLNTDGRPAVGAYDEGRYDDLNIGWSCELLAGDIRIGSNEGIQWTRSRRRIHIFIEKPSESGLISVGTAQLGARHAIVCKVPDTALVRKAASEAGSPELESHDGWQGVPQGWGILSGYLPRRAAGSSLPDWLAPLSPGTDAKIVLSGGLEIKSGAYAEGQPPIVEIESLAAGAAVTIGGLAARKVPGGEWQAPGWDAPGRHVVDVVPGPSQTYEIIADAAEASGWDSWDAHPRRFGETGQQVPWAAAVICGAKVGGPHGESLVAAPTMPALVALGANQGAAPLVPRRDLPVSVAMAQYPPSFLVSAEAWKRGRGRIVFLGHAGGQRGRPHADPDWASAVRNASICRLPLEEAHGEASALWEAAKRRARRVRRGRA